VRKARLAVAHLVEELPTLFAPDTFAALQIARFLLGVVPATACVDALALAAARPPSPVAIDLPPHAAARARESAAQCDLLRDVVGNPFRAAPAIDPLLLAWNDGCIAQLATVLCREKRFSDLPILADALEEAGCRSSALLAHLRGPGVHVPGCWALDLLLPDD
jgi:hypothetical protein